uniref:Rop guanine nucleotide exchange factor 1 n=1 Tax=Aegilops tauschii TaxID=37682 RepID=M8BVN9_AEGTA
MRMKTLGCCRRRPQDFSVDMDQEPERQFVFVSSLPFLSSSARVGSEVTTYNGLESCIFNSSSYDEDSGVSATTGADGCVTADSLEDEASSCSSSKDVDGSSFSSQCLPLSKQEEHSLYEFDTLDAIHLLPLKGKNPITYTLSAADIEIMKEKFAKLLLGDDVSGGARGVCAALALSNGITNLSATIFGELWKLEPLCEEKKIRWRKEMDWLLSPTTYMVELVPTKQNGADGCMFEIMTPKARSDVHMNLPALQKLDSMLIFGFTNGICNQICRKFWTRWWTQSIGTWRVVADQVAGAKIMVKDRPKSGGFHPLVSLNKVYLSSRGKGLCFRQNLFIKSSKLPSLSTNKSCFRSLFPWLLWTPFQRQSGRSSLGEDLYHAITTDYIPIEEIFVSLSLKTEHSVLETMNRLEGALFAWNQRISEERSRRSPARHSWKFMKDSSSELEKMSACIKRVETLIQLLKSRFPNLPPTFIDVVKVQYNEDVGHAIVEAYSRVLVGVAFSILSRVAEIMLEDDLVKKPNTPMATLKFDLSSDVYLAGITETPPGHIRRSLMDQISMVDGRFDAVVKKRGAKQLMW